MDSARRNFLRARISSTSRPAALRPPWAVAEEEFSERCNRCGDCVLACARSGSGLLQFGDGGYPVAVFNPAACTFCGDCLSACESKQSGALQRGNPPWSLCIDISSACLTEQQVVCRTCGEHCDTGALRFAPQLGRVAAPHIDHDRCTGCGDCLATCPTQAIRMVRRPNATAPLSHTPLPPTLSEAL